MPEKKRVVFHTLEIVGLLAYFLILFCERLLALIFSVRGGEEYALTSGNLFNYIAYAVTALSLLAGTALAVNPCVGMIRILRSRGLYSYEKDALPLAVAVAVILYGGMMHTGFTLAGVQFAAYGMLIAAMIVRAVEVVTAGGDKYLTILSVIYLTLFSMTIPVSYISFMEMPLRAFFFTAEYLSVLLLVPAFGYLFYRFMKEGVTSFSPLFPAVMLLLSGATVALKWSESINYFVLIFVGLTVLCYLTFGIVALRRVRSRSIEEK